MKQLYTRQNKEKKASSESDSNTLQRNFARPFNKLMYFAAIWIGVFWNSCLSQDAPWVIDFIPVANSTDSSSPSYVNDFPQGSSRLGIYCPNLPLVREREVYVLTSFMPNDIKPNIRLYSRNGTLLLTYQTGFRGHQYSFVKAFNSLQVLITSIWWSSTNEILYMIQTIQSSAAGDISFLGNPTITNSDRVVMTADLPGTRYFFGLGISYVFKLDMTSNMEAFRALPGSNNYPSFLGAFNNGQNVLVLYAPMRWAVFSTLDLTALYSNSISITFGTMTIDNMNQNNCFSVIQNPLVLQKRSLSASTFALLASVNLPVTGLSSILNVGTFDLVFLLPIIAERNPIALQNTLLFYSKSSLGLFTFRVVNSFLDPIQSSLMGFSNPPELDSGSRFYFSFVRNLYYNYQSYYFLFDKCMSLDGTALSCTTCPPGYWRAGTSFSTPRRCLPPSRFPFGTGMNNQTMTFEPCAIGSGCANCLNDFQSCQRCDFSSGYYLNPGTGACLLTSQFPANMGINPWTNQISVCKDSSCLDCKNSIYECQICDVASERFLNETSKICQSPSTFSQGFGVVRSNNTIGVCKDINCLNCATDAEVCNKCNTDSMWYLNLTTAQCQSPSSFASGFGVNMATQTIQNCLDLNCVDCKLNIESCTSCNTSAGYYRHSTSAKCLLPADFDDGFGASPSNLTIEKCADAHCMDCRENFQICVRCDILSDWYLNSTSKACQQPASFTPGFGVNTTSRSIESCSDPNCLNCTNNVRICYSCNVNNQHYWEPASWRCLDPNNFPLKFGLDTSYSIISRCVDIHCLQCPNNTGICTKCDTDNQWYLNPNTSSCVTLGLVSGSFGLDPQTGKIVSCMNPKYLDCKQDHKRCTSCNTTAGFYLNTTRSDCQTPGEFDPGFGVDVTTEQIAKCQDSNCLSCELNTQICSACRVSSGWYLNTTSSTCQNPTQFAPGYGINPRARTPSIAFCRNPYCLNCAFDSSQCTRCDCEKNYYLNMTRKDCQTPETFAAGYGVNKFSQTIDICRDRNCIGCSTDIQICTRCNSTAGWYLNTGNGVCQKPEEFPPRFGLDLLRLTMNQCEDPFCLDCHLDHKTCQKCDTDKNFYLNETSHACQAPESFGDGWGVNVTVRKIVPCKDPKCTDCSYNYERCNKCNTNEQFFLHTDNSCIKVTPSLPLMRVGANLASGKIEPCSDPSCDSCVLDVNKCSGCDFLNGFQMQGDVCIQSTAAAPKLRTAESRFRDRTVVFKFYEQIIVSNITDFFDAFKIVIHDRVERTAYVCKRNENLSIKIIRCAEQVLSKEIEIKIVSDLDMIAASMVIEDPNRVGVVPNGTIFGTESNKLFTAYPIIAANFVTKDPERENQLGRFVDGVYNFRMVTFGFLYLASPTLSLILEKSLSDLRHLGFIEGTILSYPDLLFKMMFSSRFLGNLNLVPKDWKQDYEISNCQTSPALWRMSVKCSMIANLNSELFVVPFSVTAILLIQWIWNAIQKRNQVKELNCVSPMGLNQPRHFNKQDLHLLMSERAEANPSVEGTQKNLEKFNSNERLVDQSEAKPCMASRVSPSDEVKDDFEDLPLPKDSPIKSTNGVPMKELIVPSIEQGIRQIRSENTPLDFADSENYFRDIQSANLQQGVQIKKRREIKFGSSEDIGSPTLQQSAQSLRNVAEPERGECLANQEQDIHLKSEQSGKHHQQPDDRSGSKQSGEFVTTIPEQRPQFVSNSQKSGEICKHFGTRFLFCKFEATQIDYMFLCMVNLAYYTSSYLELTGLVLAILILLFYLWQGKQFYDLTQRLPTAAGKSLLQSIEAKKPSDSQQAAKSESGDHDTNALRTAEQNHNEIKLTGTLRLLHLVKVFLVARLLVAMFESPILQIAAILLIEAGYSLYIWRVEGFLTRSCHWISNLLNMLRVTYLSLKLLIELKITSEATNQYILGYCMMCILFGSVCIIMVYSFIFVSIVLIKSLRKNNQSKPIAKKDSDKQQAPENQASSRHVGIIVSQPKPIAAIVSQEEREPGLLSNKDAKVFSRRILSGQRKKPSEPEPSRVKQVQVEDCHEDEFNRLPTLKKKPETKAVTLEAKIPIDIKVKAPTNQLNRQVDNIGV